MLEILSVDERVRIFGKIWNAEPLMVKCPLLMYETIYKIIMCGSWGFNVVWRHDSRLAGWRWEVEKIQYMSGQFWWFYLVIVSELKCTVQGKLCVCVCACVCVCVCVCVRETPINCCYVDLCVSDLFTLSQ